jgi:hypothetical protein
MGRLNLWAGTRTTSAREGGSKGPGTGTRSTTSAREGGSKGGTWHQVDDFCPRGRIDMSGEFEDNDESKLSLEQINTKVLLKGQLFTVYLIFLCY